MQRQHRLKRELAKIAKAPPVGISLTSENEDLKIFEATIIGPEGTPYENGTFQLQVSVPDNYPFSPPSFRFITKVYHPNIDDNGRICMDLTKMPPKGSWRPTLGLEGILIAIRMLLGNPNPDDPLMPEIGDEFKNNPAEYKRKAKLHTAKFAG